jgi:hypothetical protein
MARRSQWDDNPEIWKHAARLRAGGLTYSQIQGRLAGKDKARLGLEAVPTVDVIRYNLKKRSLVEATASTLPPDELEDHYRALTYMGNVLKSKIQSPLHMSEKSRSWQGFEIGEINWPEPKTEAEEEVSYEWGQASSGPESFSQYAYFRRHMSATLLGRKVINGLEAVKRTAAGYKEERNELREVVSLAVRRAFRDIDNEQQAKLAESVFSKINPTSERKTSRPRRVHRPTQRLSVQEQETTEKVNEILEQLRLSDANLELKKKLSKLTIAQSNLADALSPKTKVRKMIQDSECELCSARPLERAE